MSVDHRNVATQLSFALYGAANRMVRLHKPFLEPLALTFPQYLAILELLDAAPLSVGVLGGRLDMDTGTITPLVKRLEAAGLVTRTRDPNDERRVVVDLTPRGRGLEANVRGITRKITSACQLTPEGVDDLRRTLEGLAHPASAGPSRTKDHTHEDRYSRRRPYRQDLGAKAGPSRAQS